MRAAWTPQHFCPPTLQRPIFARTENPMRDKKRKKTAEAAKYDAFGPNHGGAFRPFDCGRTTRSTRGHVMLHGRHFCRLSALA
jgi:hypothetical protein